MEWLFVFWFLCGLAAAIALSNKGRSGCGGFLLGLLLGPIGLVIALVMKPDTGVLEREELDAGKARRCPSCAEIVKVEAVKCKHCGADLPPVDQEEIDARVRAKTVEQGFVIAIVLFIIIAIVAGNS